MKFKILALIIFILLYTGAVGWIVFSQTRKNYYVPPIAQIQSDNVAMQEADNKDEIIETLENQVAELNKKLLEKHNEENYQKPTDDIPQVDEYIPFVPDWLPELPIEETRSAITNYKWQDTENNYYMTLKIKYFYNNMTFEVTPKDLSFKQVKPKPFCASVILLSNGYGANISYDLWRIRLGSGIYISKEFIPFVGISAGWRF